MNECLNGDTHGPVHVMVGGQWHGANLQQKVIHYYTAERIQVSGGLGVGERGSRTEA